MGIRYRFDPEKAIEVLLYVAQRCPDMYTALKVVYFADKRHLARYGRFICGDRYVAMSHGPVPSNIYDLVKYVRGDGFCVTDLPVHEAFRMEGYSIVPLRAPRLDLLSESDVECLTSAIEELGHLHFLELQKRSHREQAFQEADRNDFMSVEGIARSLPDGELLLEYLRNA